ncbi:MAG: DUF3147 family protein [Planctomycetota bacterium]|jgi:uncharacterized membrane protein (GlpM family)
MKFAIYVISVCVIVFCAQVARKLPTLGGLIAVMPLTGLAALIWLYVESPADFDRMSKYTQGALWGILPSILFFLVAFLCLRKHLPLWVVLSASFGVWLAAAFIHQWLLRS